MTKINLESEGGQEFFLINTKVLPFGTRAGGFTWPAANRRPRLERKHLITNRLNRPEFWNNQSYQTL